MEATNKPSRTGFRAWRLLALFAAAIAGSAVANEVTVAVATNFAEVVEALRPDFEKQTGHTAKFIVGSTGKLYAQVTNGAPLDVFLSADQARPELLDKEGHAVPGTRFTYATGRLVLWSTDANLLTDDAASVLRGPKITHLAIANPDLAPYGAAARQVLQNLGLWESIGPRIVMGQDIGEAYAMVSTGNAEAGFVALSSLMGARDAPGGSRWEVPATLHDPIRQDAVQLKRSAENPAAAAFLQFLRSESARATISRFGYALD